MTDNLQTDKFADIVAKLTSLTLSGSLVWSVKRKDGIPYPFLTAERGDWSYELSPESATLVAFSAALSQKPHPYSLEARNDVSGDFAHIPPMLALGVLAKAALRPREQAIDRLLHDLG